MSNKCCRCWVTCGAILLGLGVIVGAVAAHGLDERLQEVHGDKPGIERLGGPITAAAKALDDIRVGDDRRRPGRVTRRNPELASPGRWNLFRPGHHRLLRRTLRPGHHRHLQLRAGSSNRRHIDDRRLVPVGSRYVSLWNAIDTGPLERISTRSHTLITFFQRKPHRCPMPHS